LGASLKFYLQPTLSRAPIYRRAASETEVGGGAD